MIVLSGEPARQNPCILKRSREFRMSSVQSAVPVPRAKRIRSTVPGIDLRRFEQVLSGLG
jgi:hypothetical protein